MGVRGDLWSDISGENLTRLRKGVFILPLNLLLLEEAPKFFNFCFQSVEQQTECSVFIGPAYSH